MPRRRGPVFLGRAELGWCTSCNLPLLDKACGRCGSRAKLVPLTPPGDARPALKGDLELLRGVISSQFGARAAQALVPRNKLLVLNRVPALDRADEVVLDGQVVGLLRFDPLKLAPEFLLKLEGARRLAEAKAEGWVVADPGAAQSILEGSNLLSPGVSSVDPTVEAGEEVYVVNPSGRAIGVGRSRMSAEEMGQKRGIAVKIRRRGEPKEPEVLPGGQSWEDAVEANREALIKQEQRAQSLIKRTIEKNPSKPCVVAFSGGKDSLATLLLARGVIEKLQAIFVDTGLEFPETLEYSRRVTKELGVDLLVESAGDGFWRELKHFGPPGRDFRWCCKTCKLGPTAKLISRRFPKGCITLVGQRRFESDQRARQPRAWENPWIPGQLGLSPIREWAAMQVWLYIFSKGVEFNPLYEKGLERIGCWLCPASELWEFELLKELHPELWRRWAEALREYAKELGYPSAWVELGFWRWLELPPGQLELAQRAGVRLEPSRPRRLGELSYKLAPGFNPCGDGRFSIEGSFSLSLNLERVANLLLTLGEVKNSPKLGVVRVKIEAASASIYRTGKFTVIGDGEEQITQAVGWLTKAVVRAERCVGCGVCVVRCPQGAISLSDGRATIAEGCSRCFACYERCPALVFDSFMRSAARAGRGPHG